MSLLKKLAGETLIYGGSFIIGRVLYYFVNTIYLTRVFDKETAQYGLYSDFYFYLAFLLVLLTMRMETTFFRFGNQAEDREKAFSAAASTLIGTALFWLAILLLAYPMIAQALDYPDMGTHVLVLGGVLVFDILVAIPFARLRLENRPVQFAILKLGGIVINVLLMIFFLEMCPRMIENGNEFAGRIYKPENRLLYIFISNLIASGVVWLALLPKYFKVKWQFDQKMWRKMLLYAAPLIIVGLAGVINQSSYITFQKYLLPASITENLSEGGVYAAAAKLAVLMSLFTTAFNYAAEPFFFQQAKEGNNLEIYAKVARAFSASGAIVFVGLMLYIDIVQLILGKSYREGMAVVPILLVAYFMLGIYYNFSIWYKLKDKTHLGAIISLGGAAITVILNIVLIKKYEVVGSAWAAVACYFFMVVICYLWGRRYFKVPYAIGRMFFHLASAIGIYLFSIWINDIIAANLLLKMAINTGLVLCYIFALWKLEWPYLRS